MADGNRLVNIVGTALSISDDKAVEALDRITAEFQTAVKGNYLCDADGQQLVGKGAFIEHVVRTGTYGVLDCTGHSRAVVDARGQDIPRSAFVTPHDCDAVFEYMG
jgi:hypothetical protein